MTQTLPPTPYHVLLMTATVIVVDAQNPLDAAQQALLAAPQVIDPAELQWYARHVSEQPIVIDDGSISLPDDAAPTNA